uniref:C2H2-type domain-containing protein n=1 Tax=Macaca fascicularis TaxID=9541 RepID=A0A2K5WZC2_MACFA
MAAAALTSLSTSPLLLGAPVAAFSPEPGLEPWKEALLRPPGSYSSSSNSGDWGWDLASDQSSPSTPSPPLPPEAAHFLFGEPTLRKRKSPAQVMFQCLWKSCGKVLSTASAMQRHIRLVHLGRQAEPEQSDGEEDFYYTELDVGVDTLTDGLSSLTPVSPTASMPPAFPRLELPELLEPPALPSPLRPTALPLPPPPPPVLSAVANPQSCHSDRVYQGCLTPARLEPQPTEVGACPPALSSRTGVSLRCVWAEGLRPPPAGEGPRLTAPHALCPPPGSPAAMRRSAGKCMAWSAGTCGAQPAAGRRPASGSWTKSGSFKNITYHLLPPHANPRPGAETAQGEPQGLAFTSCRVCF